MRTAVGTVMLVSSTLASASLIGINANVTITQSYSLGLGGFTSTAFDPLSASGIAFSLPNSFRVGPSGCSVTSCSYIMGYNADLSGLASGKTVDFLSRLSQTAPLHDSLAIEIRSNTSSRDSISATFLRHGTSWQEQVNATTRKESIYNQELRLTAYGEFFADAVLPAFTSDSIETLWEHIPFQYLSFEERYFNGTYTKGANDSYSLTAQDGETIVGGMNGQPNATFSTFRRTVPEPGTTLLMMAGFIGVWLKSRKAITHNPE